MEPPASQTGFNFAALEDDAEEAAPVAPEPTVYRPVSGVATLESFDIGFEADDDNAPVGPLPAAPQPTSELPSAPPIGPSFGAPLPPNPDDIVARFLEVYKEKISADSFLDTKPLPGQAGPFPADGAHDSTLNDLPEEFTDSETIVTGAYGPPQERPLHLDDDESATVPVTADLDRIPRRRRRASRMRETLMDQPGTEIAPAGMRRVVLFEGEDAPPPPSPPPAPVANGLLPSTLAWLRRLRESYGRYKNAGTWSQLLGWLRGRRGGPDASRPSAALAPAAAASETLGDGAPARPSATAPEAGYDTVMDILASAGGDEPDGAAPAPVAPAPAPAPEKAAAPVFSSAVEVEDLSAAPPDAAGGNDVANDDEEVDILGLLDDVPTVREEQVATRGRPTVPVTRAAPPPQAPAPDAPDEEEIGGVGAQGQPPKADTAAAWSAFGDGELESAPIPDADVAAKPQAKSGRGGAGADTGGMVKISGSLPVEDAGDGWLKISGAVTTPDDSDGWHLASGDGSLGSGDGDGWTRVAADLAADGDDDYGEVGGGGAAGGRGGAAAGGEVASDDGDDVPSMDDYGIDTSDSVAIADLKDEPAVARPAPLAAQPDAAKPAVAQPDAAKRAAAAAPGGKGAASAGGAGQLASDDDWAGASSLSDGWDDVDLDMLESGAAGDSLANAEAEEGTAVVAAEPAAAAMEVPPVIARLWQHGRALAAAVGGGLERLRERLRRRKKDAAAATPGEDASAPLPPVDEDAIIGAPAPGAAPAVSDVTPDVAPAVSPEALAELDDILPTNDAPFAARDGDWPDTGSFAAENGAEGPGGFTLSGDVSLDGLGGVLGDDDFMVATPAADGAPRRGWMAVAAVRAWERAVNACKAIDRVVDFRKNWWLLVDGLAIVIMTISFAVILAYFLYYR